MNPLVVMFVVLGAGIVGCSSESSSGTPSSSPPDMATSYACDTVYAYTGNTSGGQGHYYKAVVLSKDGRTGDTSYATALAAATASTYTTSDGRVLQGHLLTLSDANEQTFVQSVVGGCWSKTCSNDKTCFPYASMGTAYWLGIDDRTTEADWSKWANGETVSYTKWLQGQPDDLPGYVNASTKGADCAATGTSSQVGGMMWWDDDCTRSKQSVVTVYVVEYE